MSVQSKLCSGESVSCLLAGGIFAAIFLFSSASPFVEVVQPSLGRQIAYVTILNLLAIENSPVRKEKETVCEIEVERLCVHKHVCVCVCVHACVNVCE